MIPRTVARRRTVPATLAKQFHASARRGDGPGKSAFQTFVDVLKDEIRKNRELQDNVKQLQGDVDKLQDSEAMKKARAAYERARLTSSLKENPRLKAAADELRKRGVKVGDAVGEALKGMEESEIMRAISKATSAVSTTIDKTTEPIRKTAAYKSLSETIIDALDDSGSAKHAGFEAKDARRLRRQQRLLKAGKIGRAVTRKTEENTEAGSSVVLHKDAAKDDKWEKLKESTPLLRQFAALKQTWDESENPLVSSVRSFTHSITSFFDENETARVIRKFQEIDPDFDMGSFERELREYIVPEVVDAFLSADREALLAWCSEATYNLLWATMEQYLKQGLISDSKVLDIRQVDVIQGTLTEDDIPTFLIQFSSQEVLLFKNAKTQEIVVGAENKVEQSMYVAALTRIPEELDNEITGGWKIVSMMRRSSRAYL
ncbi:TIM44 subunit of mitochondria import inner membrane translocase [Cylindrobasidium torrendii FP15055 ss-10]|uniref:Mitochondrial import inner membrane translocase subunit TIM44 n=1 Tax=Cylindrobasidium torrendii FP15055 ss-10 TaxID=1314674 RepID=A0A0D7BKR7_9AGAR|nr:TIM44 subunit of mitochondria import inner membrane translocase [Cylindrobasidium torrendii FP15055 ss-10]